MARCVLGLIAGALIVLTSSPAEGRSSLDIFGPVREDANYDMLVLVQMWPPSFCLKPNSNCIPLDTLARDWTIHGLWPAKNKVKASPINCDPSATFQSSALSGIRTQLETKWPSVKTGVSSDQFWTHEYKRHGTCAKDLPYSNTQLKYFKLTLDLADEFKLKNFLKAANIGPSSTLHYYPGSIEKALREGIGAEPAIFCIQEKGVQILWEVRICLDKTLNPVNCGQNLAGGGRCSPFKRVIYPLFPAPPTGSASHPSSKIWSMYLATMRNAKDDDVALDFQHDLAEMGAEMEMRKILDEAVDDGFIGDGEDGDQWEP